MNRIGMLKLGLVAVLAALGTVTSDVAAATLSPAAISDSNRVHQQLIVTWKRGSSESQRAAALARLGATSRLRLAGTATLPGGAPAPELIDVGATSRAKAARSSLASNSAVASVERNTLIHAAGKPPLPAEFNDPLLSGGCPEGGFRRECEQWGLLGNTYAPSAAFGTNAVEAWAQGDRGSSNVYVGVIDEGIDINHPDLSENVWTNPYDPPDGIDNDGNGYVDDSHGWDFFHNDNTVFDGQEQKDFIDAHGTIVAGEIGANSGNGTGGAGVAWHVGMISAKFLGPEFGTTAGAIAAINYITDLKLRHGINIVATNNSWGGSEEAETPEEEKELEELPALQEAIQGGADAGILFVAGAGNERRDIDVAPEVPNSLECHLSSGSDCMITVTAINRSGGKWHYSNWGPKAVDIGAPGRYIWSTFPFDSYAGYTGTSQAAPFVAGAVALYAARYPEASPTQIREAILSTAKRTKSLEGLVGTNGRLSIKAALAHPPE